MSILKTPRAAEFIGRLHARLPEATVRHVISVASWMKHIALETGINQDQAVWAGLLHDYCKAESADALRASAEQFALPVPDFYRSRGRLLHGPVAAEVCKRELGVDDPTVHDAVYWHTTGCPDWNPIGLALYFADFTEPFRTLPVAFLARERFRKDGYLPALRFVVRERHEHIREKFGLDPHSERFYAWVMNGHL